MSDDSFGRCEEYLKDNNILSKLINPSEFREKLQTIKEKTPHILAEFKNVFVLYNKNPEYTDYQQMFANIQANVTNINSQLFTDLNDVQFNIDELNKNIFCLNGLIVKEKNKNKKFKELSGIIEEKNNAASELIYDYKKIYEEGYLRNWGLIISIIIIGFAVKNIYGNISGNINQNVANIGNSVKNMGSNLYNNAKNTYNKVGNTGK
jgi:hypothetical protein